MNINVMFPFPSEYLRLGRWGKPGASVENKLDIFLLFYSVCLRTARLLISVHGIMKDFEIIEDLATMHQVKKTTIGSDLFTDVSARSDRLCWKVLEPGAEQVWGENGQTLQDKVTKMN